QRTVGKGAVWVTAMLSLLPGLPHFRCFCPDGHVKPLCLVPLSGGPGSCCGRECCAAQAPGEGSQAPQRVAPAPPKPRACCGAGGGHADSGGSPAQKPHAQVGGAGCKRVFAQTDSLAVPKEAGAQESGKAFSSALPVPPADGAPVLAAEHSLRNG